MRKYLNLIADVAKQNHYSVKKEGLNQLDIEDDRWYGQAFHVGHRSDSGYIEVFRWETNEEYRTVFSLRNLNDVIRFCNMLIHSEELRAKRKV